jgi:asparagine synthase (glutamine-hydrolysing)
MQRGSTQPVNTFCIGFEEKGFDEAVYAKKIALHLGCHHTELYVTPQQAREVIPLLPQLYDEPFADASQIPTYLVSQLARRHVTVSLSGDGGDELFYGYGTYARLFKRWDRARRFPVRNRLIQQAILKLLGIVWRPGDKRLAAVKSLLSSRSDVDVHRFMVFISHNPSALVLGSQEPPTVLSESDRWPNIAGRENRIMALDVLSYLPDDVLAKVDRAAMACSLETRIPLLDHRIVEFAFRLPFDLKCRAGVRKWPLRQILFKYVPRALVERPKKGFSVPIAQWLRHELKEWMCDSLQSDTITKDGILDVNSVQDYMQEHVRGQYDHSEILWNLLMFQCWLHRG